MEDTEKRVLMMRIETRRYEIHSSPMGRTECVYKKGCADLNELGHMMLPAEDSVLISPTIISWQRAGSLERVIPFAVGVNAGNI